MQDYNFEETKNYVPLQLIAIAIVVVIIVAELIQ